MAKKNPDATVIAETSDEIATDSEAADWTWADPSTLQVNPAFQRLIPLQSRGELLALEESINAEGCRDPLIVWKDRSIILDGHTRRELCIKHGKQVKVREVELPDEKAAIEYILQLQRQRRNLTREAMSYFRGAEYNAVKQQHGGSRRGRKPKDQSEPLKSTAGQLAEKYGVAEMTIKRDAVFAQVIDKIVEEYGNEEIRRKLLGADVKLTQGTARVLLRMPSKQRKASVDQLIEQGELPRTKRDQAKKRERTITLPKRPKQFVTSMLEHFSQDEIAEVYKALGEAIEKQKGQEGEEDGQGKGSRKRKAKG
jgi:hypothetical protein